MVQVEPTPRSETDKSTPAVPDIADRPSLAPEIELSGQMQEGGFEQQQWLIVRSGQFVQVTELLYRVAEAIDGKRTLEEIASAVSESTEKNVSADNIRTLLGNKLIPLGIVTSADGSVQTPPGAEDGASRSPLQINLRTTVLSPRLINPVTAVLMQLYRPPILIAVLGVTVVAQGWVFFIHGIGGSVHQALYQPGLMLVILGFIVASAAFHEFGHASALRYGGGKVRGMGVGMYLVYPAFYTDVTDNYRLSRWNKIRTDLGGFYFNLIFALATLGIYAVTRQEFLLLVMLLVDLEIIHQTLPFVRLDGYWALADLTGLPDFFSQIGPFLRTYLPIPGWKGRKLADLKGWVKIVFAVYILITIPLLLFLLLFMVISVPRFLGTSWDSLAKQGTQFHHAQVSTDVVGMVFAGVQILLLALPTLGMLYILFTLARRILTALWRWSKPTPTRRVIGAAILVSIIGGVAFLWAPRLPGTRTTSGPFYAVTSFQPVSSREAGTLGDFYHSSGHVVSVAFSRHWTPPVTGRAGFAGLPFGSASDTHAGSGPPRSGGHGTSNGKGAQPAGTPQPGSAAVSKTATVTAKQTAAVHPTVGAGTQPTGVSSSQQSSATPGSTGTPAAVVAPSPYATLAPTYPATTPVPALTPTAPSVATVAPTLTPAL